MTLQNYIRKVTPGVFADKFGISLRAAQSYLYGWRRPKPALAQRIVDATPVTWEGIYSSVAREPGVSSEEAA